MKAVSKGADNATNPGKSTPFDTISASLQSLRMLPLNSYQKTMICLVPITKNPVSLHVLGSEIKNQNKAQQKRSRSPKESKKPPVRRVV